MFWGINRFKVQPIALPATVALTQTETAVWTFANATATFNPTQITLAPTASPVTATLALGSFANPPYQILALIQALTLAWSGAGIASAAVTLQGIDNAVTTLATAPGTYPWPPNPAAAKYAGSWGQDFGVGFTAHDIGADALPAGISAAEMASDENDFAYQLALGRTAARLVFTFTLADPTQPIQLGYPVFTLPAQPPAVVQETGDTAIALWPNGPGIRFGSWAWWVSGAWQNPPAVRPFGQTSTILDWLAFKRVVAVPKTADAGLDAEIATLYDPVELSTRGDLAADTHSFVAVPNAKLAGFLVSALAELPPLAVFPGRARNADLQPTGAFALEGWSHAKGPRDLVGAPVPANLFDPGGAQWTAPTGAPAGWCIARHDRAVTNSEDATFTVRSGGTTYAHASPWHGYSCVLLPGEGAQPWILQSDFGELHLAYLIAGDIYYKWSPFPVPLWQVETRITTDGGWSNPRMCLDHRGRIELRAVQSATVRRFVSDDDGRTWQA